jgi:hypothetical protein
VLHAASHVDEFLHLETEKAEKVKKGCFTTRISYARESEDFEYEPNSDAILEGVRDTLQVNAHCLYSTPSLKSTIVPQPCALSSFLAAPM